MSEDGQWIEAWNQGNLRAEYRSKESVTFQEEWTVWLPSTTLTTPVPQPRQTPKQDPTRQIAAVN